ncbi:hypothetical protein NSP46_25635, partial [Salmonella enterica]|nr:hypothetical protein [Salmonella enterica]
MQALKPRHSNAASGRNRRARSLAVPRRPAANGVARPAFSVGVGVGMDKRRYSDPILYSAARQCHSGQKKK